MMKNIIKKVFAYLCNQTENEDCREIESCACGLEIKLLFEKENVFIAPDRDGYRGGMWKKFDGNGRRIGTWNIDLTELIGNSLDLKIDIFKKDCVSDFCVNGTEGEIRIGYYKETLYIPFDWWSMHKYQLQWQQGINRLRYYDKSCLVVAISNPDKRCYIEWWPLYKIDGKIYIQNHIITNDICEKIIGDNLFTVETCYDFIPKYQSHTEEGIKISEWVVDWDGKIEE